MDGVRIIHDIVTYILTLGAVEHDGSLDQSPEQPTGVESVGECSRKACQADKIERIDAKTLNLCVESIASLVNEDVRAFMALPLLQRIEIFRQMSQLLDISYRLYPLLEQRKLKPFAAAVQQKRNLE